jgi:hypothetical protein
MDEIVRFQRKPSNPQEEEALKKLTFHAAEFLFEVCLEPKFRTKYKVDQNLKDTFIGFYRSYFEDAFLNKKIKDGIPGDNDSHIRYLHGKPIAVYFGEDAVQGAWKLFRKKYASYFTGRVKYITEDLLNRVRIISTNWPENNGDLHLLSAYLIVRMTSLGNGMMRIEGSQIIKQFRGKGRTIRPSLPLKVYK